MLHVLLRKGKIARVAGAEWALESTLEDEIRKEAGLGFTYEWERNLWRV